MNANLIVLGVTWFVVFLFSITLHEAGHAFAAYKLGDPTAYEGGQVSLNPLPHIRREPVGMILVPLVSFVASHWMMGWASAPYDPSWAHRYPKRAALMAAAGPAANLLLVLVAGLLIQIGVARGIFYAPERANFTTVIAAVQGSWAAGAVTPLSILFSLNLLLFAFNLLPLPPLDGSAILPALMSDDAARRFHDFIRQPTFSFIGLIAAWRLFPAISEPLQTLALNLLFPGAGYHSVP
jgi:Zn-dependent protease